MRARLVQVRDVDRLQSIERDAGQLFAAVGMPEIAADEPFSVDELLVYQRAGRAWAVVDDGDHAIAYVLVDVIDGCAHVEQVSVHPDHAGQGIGSQLLDVVSGWAADHDLAALTLLTFGDIPWNGPYYERLGFRVVPETGLSPGLAALREAEPAKGLDPARRVAMRRDLGERRAMSNVLCRRGAQAEPSHRFGPRGAGCHKPQVCNFLWTTPPPGTAEPSSP